MWVFVSINFCVLVLISAKKLPKLTPAKMNQYFGHFWALEEGSMHVLCA